MTVITAFNIDIQAVVNEHYWCFEPCILERYVLNFAFLNDKCDYRLHLTAYIIILWCINGFDEILHESKV